MFNKKAGNVTFFLDNIDLSICPYTYEICRFFSNFWKARLSKNIWVVFANRFNRLSRKFVSVVRSFFAKTYPNFVTVDNFFKTKKKFRRLEKNGKNSYLFG